MSFTYWLGYDAQDVSFRYRENLPLVLQKLCLQLTPGQRVGVVGRTGSGKSTLLRRGEKPIGKNIAEKKIERKKWVEHILMPHPAGSYCAPWNLLKVQ